MQTDELARKRVRKAIDWSAIRHRLDAANAAIDHTAASDPEEIRRILIARAETLSRPSRWEEAEHEAIELLEFVLAQERYAIETRFVREVYPLEQLTPLPCTPPFVLGIFNLRGEILSVIDIKKFFDLPDKGLTDLNKVIVLESDGMCFGVLADAIVGVHDTVLADIQPSLPTLTGVRDMYLKGVTAETVVILDALALLTDPDIVVREQAPA